MTDAEKLAERLLQWEERWEHGEDVPAPAIRQGLLHVPAPGGEVFDLLHQDDMVEPWNIPERIIVELHSGVLLNLCFI